MRNRSWGSYRQKMMPAVGVLTAALVGGLLFVPVMHHFADRARAQAMFLPIDRVPYDAEAVVAHVMEYALQSEEANDVVFAGDSTGLCAITPRLFTAQTGLQAYNLGTVGSLGIDGLQVVIQHYLAHHPKPRVIVLCIEPGLFMKTPMDDRIYMRFMGMFKPRRETWLPSEARLEVIAEEAVLGIRGMWGNFGNVKSAERMPGPAGMTVNDMWECLTTQRGYWCWQTKNEGCPSLAPCGEIQEKYQRDVEQFIHLATSHGVPLLIRLTPVPDTQGKLDFSALAAWLRELERQNEGKVLISRPDIVRYPPDQFGDYRHLRQCGAEKFTAFMAEEITRSLTKAAASPSANRVDVDLSNVDDGDPQRQSAAPTTRLLPADNERGASPPSAIARAHR